MGSKTPAHNNTISQRTCLAVFIVHQLETKCILSLRSVIKLATLSCCLAVLLAMQCHHLRGTGQRSLTTCKLWWLRYLLTELAVYFGTLLCWNILIMSFQIIFCIWKHVYILWFRLVRTRRKFYVFHKSQLTWLRKIVKKHYF